MPQEPEAAIMTKLCPRCLAENEDSAHLCRACCTPLTGHAATDPFLSTVAEASTFGRAANSPRNGVVLLGMWLLLGPVALGSVLGIFYMLTERFSLMIFPYLLAAFISIALLRKTTTNYGKPAIELTDDPLDDADREPGEEIAADDPPEVPS